MVSWLASLFGSAKSVEKVVDTGAKVVETAASGIYNGVDKLFYTEEEKADGKQKAFDTLLEFWKTFANENSEQSKARRDIALMSMKAFFALIFMAVAVYGFDKEFAGFIFSVVKELVWLVGMIAATYFVPHQLSKIVDFRGKDSKA